MIRALLVLLGSELLGEGLRALTHAPVPGPVIGMMLLALALVATRRRRAHPHASARLADLDRVARALITNMGLLFVPAGVGVIAQAGLVRAQLLPIVAGLVGSTVIGLVVTALVMHWTLPREAADTLVSDEAAA